MPRLADEQRYPASESTIYRVLRAADQQHRRGRSQPPRTVKAPTSHVATAANPVWSWDITCLPTAVQGQYFYLYPIEDIYSHKAVGWEVYEQESGELGVALLQKMYNLGVAPSHSRPRVSDDTHTRNPCSGR
ncbi:putative transposase [Azotobacter beijerinckii]|uniref:Putative transposase n=1 Tax=Azotobacter beijerinckii TaxID=170623 RepID=A0A1H6U7S5_9GAMM|nr:putative transposase [Azotobacter beijerinckii]